MLHYFRDNTGVIPVIVRRITGYGCSVTSQQSTGPDTSIYLICIPKSLLKSQEAPPYRHVGGDISLG